MIHWAHPEFLVLGLGLVLVIALMFARYERKRRWALATFAGELADRLAHAEPAFQRRERWALRIAALALLVVAAAGPRWGEEVVRVTTQGSDFVFVFDVSRSMDARDVPPSRLEEAKREALSLLDGMEGDRIGLVAFAGDAVALSPLTLDLSAVRLLIETMTTDVVSTPGSDVGRGLKQALRVQPEGDTGEQAIVLFTDGEDLEGGLTAAGAVVQQRGVKVFAVGVGTKGGETIPLTDAQGRQIGVKTDPQGQPVVSHLDAEALRELARRTHGRYFSADHPGGEIGALRAALGAVGRGTRQGRLGSRPVERFHWFAIIAWTFLVASWLLPERAAGAFVLPGMRKERKGNGNGSAGARAAALAIATGALLLFAPSSARAEHPLITGNRLYAKGDFAAAVRVYQAALKQHPDDPALLTNLGAALYRQKDYKGAEEAFARARAKDPRLEGLASYGKGDAQFRQERYREALDSFRDALEKRPGDADARHNYELTLRKLQGKENPDQKPPPQPPPPKPGQGGGGGGGGGGGTPPSPPKPAGGGSPPPQGQIPQGGANGRMSRAEAERLLDALANGERQARAAQQRAAGGEERKEKDW
jgi:Ca-activated chloride channel family protein